MVISTQSFSFIFKNFVKLVIRSTNDPDMNLT